MFDDNIVKLRRGIIQTFDKVCERKLNTRIIQRQINSELHPP